MNNVQPLQDVSRLISLLDDIDSNLVYILKELPNNNVDQDLRRRIELTCQAFRRSLEERQGEVALANVLLRGYSPAEIEDIPPTVARLARTIDAGLSTDCFEIQLAVAHVRIAVGKSNSNAMGSVLVLVEESAANILNAFWTIHDLLKLFLPPDRIAS